MEYDAAEAVFNGYGHLACRAVGRVQVDHRHARRLATHVSRIDEVEHLESHAPSRTVEAALILAVAAGDRAGGEAGTYLPVGRVQTVAVGDCDIVVDVEQRRGDLRNLARVFHCRLAAFTQQVDLGLLVRGVGDDFDRVYVGINSLDQVDISFDLAVADNIGDRTRAGEQSGERGVGRRRADRTSAEQRAYADAGYRRVGYLVDFAAAHDYRVRAGVFDEHLGEIRAGRHGARQRLGELGSCNHDNTSPFLDCINAMRNDLYCRVATILEIAPAGRCRTNRQVLSSH